MVKKKKKRKHGLTMKQHCRVLERLVKNMNDLPMWSEKQQAARAKADAYARKYLGWESSRPTVSAPWLYDFVKQVISWG